MSSEIEYWLERIASAADIAERANRYDDWSPTYDADMLSTGSPSIAVASCLVGRHVAPSGARVLDAGAGTGLVGAILHAAGYRDITGIDMSGGMLEQARRRGVYAELRQAILGDRLDFVDGRFTAITAVGVFGFGHAPPDSLDELTRVTARGGFLVFNVNTPPWEKGGFKEKVESLIRTGRWVHVETAGPYQPMPLSRSRGHIETRTFVYRRL